MIPISPYIRPLCNTAAFITVSSITLIKMINLNFHKHVFWATLAPCNTDSVSARPDASTFLFHFFAQLLLKQLIVFDEKNPIPFLRAPIITTLAIAILGKIAVKDLLGKQISWGYALGTAFFNRLN